MALVLVLALLALPAQAAAQGDYIASPRKAVEGNDIPCGQLNAEGKLAKYCRECGGLNYLASSCSGNKKCRGFSMETFSCGYLKNDASPDALQYYEGFTSFCKLASGNTCAGDWMVHFNADIEGEELDCNYKEEGVKKDFCRVQGNVLALMDACQNNRRCEAFTLSAESNGKSGWLKAASSPRTRKEGWITFVKRPS